VSGGALVESRPLDAEGESLAGLNDNRFLVVAVACRRVMQLRSGARPHLDPGLHKHCVMAVAEVVAGTVPYCVS
jgi:DNA-directed RNA polymerase subunit K/omega